MRNGSAPGAVAAALLFLTAATCSAQAHSRALSSSAVRCRCSRAAPPALARATNYAIGLVLTGGSAFGAWEAGALEALFDYWNEKFGTDPPIRIVAGTSTGALIAPFAALDQAAVEYVACWYQSVTSFDIYGGHLWPGNGLFHFGYPSNANGDGCFLYLHYAQVLKGLRACGKDPLRELAKAWSESDPARRRIVAASTINFLTGQPDYVVNGERDLPSKTVLDDDLCHSRFYDGIFASTVPPLIGEPVPLTPADDPAGKKTQHYDGGPYAEAPFDLLFSLAEEQKVSLSHVVMISSYPYFPGSDQNPAQKKVFPRDAHLLKTAARFDTLLSESAVTTGYRIASLTLQSAALLDSRNPTDIRRQLRLQTGLKIPLQGPLPILVGAFPSERLGYDNNDFREDEMAEMYRRGKTQARPVFEAYFK
jgi:predicted acylesterase/phospholipase RssA